MNDLAAYAQKRVCIYTAWTVNTKPFWAA